MKTDEQLLLSDLPNNDVAAYLEEIGDLDGAQRFRRVSARGQAFGGMFGSDAYMHSGVLVGYVEPGTDTTAPIAGGNQVLADGDLRDRPLKITLEQFFVQNYPGIGRHRILCDFAGQNQAASEAEEIKFALTVEASDGNAGGVHGKPLFTGVQVGVDGLSFRGQTTIVRSDVDDLILEALGSDAFRHGLSLLSTAQPVLKPFVGLATGAVKSVLGRRKNKPVFRFDLGLDFSGSTQATRLRRGSYVIVQHAADSWDWRRFQFDRTTRTVLRGDGEGRLALNYLVIGVDLYEGAMPERREREATPRRARPASTTGRGRAKAGPVTS